MSGHNTKGAQATLKAEPTARTHILIRRPVAEVFEAFVDPEVTRRFWFTRGSKRLAPGENVSWHWDMYGVSVTVLVADEDRGWKTKRDAKELFMSRRLSLLMIGLVPLVIATLAATVKSGEVDDASAQREIRAAIDAIVRDAEAADLDGLASSHLDSPKFSKFGPRTFERQDVASTNASEAAFFGSIANYKQEVRDLKIDVFGDIGIATYYPHVSFEQDGQQKVVSGRQTFVFLRTDEGWKLVHEHGTIKR